MIRFAVFDPTPGILVKLGTSPAIILFLRLSVLIPDNIVIASFGPIPLIDISRRKVCLSSLFTKP